MLTYKHILVLGGTSTIAQALLKQLQPRGNVTLAGRNPQELQKCAAKLHCTCPCHTHCVPLDLTQNLWLPTFIQTLQANPDIDLMILAQGSMPPLETMLQHPKELFQVNLVSVTEAIHACVRHTRQCDILVLGSVAGSRGRASNFPYGSAKAAVRVFCEGYQTQLPPTHGIYLAQLGRVHSKMTRGQKGSLFSTPAVIARSLVLQLQKKHPVAYHPRKWKWIHRLLLLLPRNLLPR